MTMCRPGGRSGTRARLTSGARRAAGRSRNGEPLGFMKCDDQKPRFDSRRRTSVAGVCGGSGTSGSGGAVGAIWRNKRGCGGEGVLLERVLGDGGGGIGSLTSARSTGSEMVIFEFCGG